MNTSVCCPICSPLPTKLAILLKQRGVEIRVNPVTGEDMVEINDLEKELRRMNMERRRREFDAKAPVDAILTDMIENLLEAQEETVY